jgi:hypothetical protein
MFKLRIALGVASSLVAVAALTIVFAGTGEAQGNGNGPNVTVVNTPLPVTGNLTATIPGTVNVTGNVNAAVTGTVNATVSGQVTVNNPSNNPVLVRDVDGVQQEFFQQRREQFLQSAGVGTLNFDAVPAGKRLVVEYVSIEVGAAIAICRILTLPSQDFGQNCALQPTFGQASGALQPPWAANALTKFSVLPGDHLQVTTVGQQPVLSNPWTLAGTISGYFVPYP